MINHLFSPGCKQVRKLEAITHDVEPNQINQEHLPNLQGRVGGGDTESSSSTVLLLSNLKGRVGNIVVGNCLQIRRGGRGALASSFATAAGRFVWEGGEPWRRDADNTTNTISNNLQLRRSGRNSRYKQDHSFVYGTWEHKISQYKMIADVDIPRFDYHNHLSIAGRVGFVLRSGKMAVAASSFFFDRRCIRRSVAAAIAGYLEEETGVVSSPENPALPPPPSSASNQRRRTPLHCEPVRSHKGGESGLKERRQQQPRRRRRPAPLPPPASSASVVSLLCRAVAQPAETKTLPERHC
nr:hypothetical protein Iba_chr11cCG11210 [Ipomoea batatas]